MRTHETLDDRTRHFRDQLGLPTDKSVIMSGHQAGLWHSGILAKLLAADVLAARTNAAVAWLVIDFDESIPGQIALPAKDNTGRLKHFEWSSLHGTNGIPLGEAARKPTAPGADPALPEGWSFSEQTHAAAADIMSALAAHASKENIAQQATSALFDLLELPFPRLRDRVHVVYASSFSQTALFQDVLYRATKRPQTMQSLYNDAAAQHPEAQVRALITRHDSALELPIAQLQRGETRKAAGEVHRWVRRERLFDADLSANECPPAHELAPRGMLMSAMARLAGCDLFIHGTGGRAYEPINDAWFGRWMDAKLAPFVTATADVTLDLDGNIVTDEQAARARWRAHHARHHPAELGDDEREGERDRLVRAIDDAPRGSVERNRLYRELHGVLDDANRAHEAELRELDTRAGELTTAATERALREDRTWSFALHDAETLVALRDAIDARFSK